MLVTKSDGVTFLPLQHPTGEVATMRDWQVAGGRMAGVRGRCQVGLTYAAEGQVRGWSPSRVPRKAPSIVIIIAIIAIDDGSVAVGRQYCRQ